jgi:hypothetical protein
VANTHAAGGIVIQGVVEIVCEAVFSEFLSCTFTESVISKCSSRTSKCNNGPVGGLFVSIIEVD